MPRTPPAVRRKKRGATEQRDVGDAPAPAGGVSDGRRTRGERRRGPTTADAAAAADVDDVEAARVAALRRTPARGDAADPAAPPRPDATSRRHARRGRRAGRGSPHLAGVSRVTVTPGVTRGREWVTNEPTEMGTWAVAQRQQRASIFDFPATLKRVVRALFDHNGVLWAVLGLSVYPSRGRVR